MEGSMAVESEINYPDSDEQQPPIDVLIKDIQSAKDQQSVQQVIIRFGNLLDFNQDQKFSIYLKAINVVLLKGYSSILIEKNELIKTLMNHFIKLSQKLQNQSGNQNIQANMFYVLSIVAELIRQNPKFYFPFTKKFLLTAFRIDRQFIQNSPKRRDILAVLSVIYENSSRQLRLLNRHNLVQNLKKILLENYGLIDELFTIKLFNRSIARLFVSGVNFKASEFSKYKILQTLANFISNKEMEIFALKLKMFLSQLKG